MEKKLFDILKIVQKNPVFGKTLMCGDMLDEERMGILYEILYLIGKKDLLARQIFLCLLILLDEQEQMIRK